MKGKVIFSYEWWNAKDQDLPIPEEHAGVLHHEAWHIITEAIRNKWKLEGYFYQTPVGTASYRGMWTKREEVE